VYTGLKLNFLKGNSVILVDDVITIGATWSLFVNWSLRKF